MVQLCSKLDRFPLVCNACDKNKTTVQNIDLRRKVRLKQRNHSKVNRFITNKAIEERTYADFYLSMARIKVWISLRLIQKKIKEEDGKCLLTIHFMLAFLTNHKRQEYVSEIFLYLQNKLCCDEYKRLFPVILTDRGSEFFNSETIVFSSKAGEQLTHIFYCDSFSS